MKDFTVLFPVSCSKLRWVVQSNIPLRWFLFEIDVSGMLPDSCTGVRCVSHHSVFPLNSSRNSTEIIPIQRLKLLEKQEGK